MNLLGKGVPLTDKGLNDVCASLGVGAAEIWALVFTETDPPYGGFWPDRRPQILYEQHIFHRLTNGRFDQVAPDVSNSRSGNYGHTGDHQYVRLRNAMDLDETAALESTSWGLGQVLGENFSAAGFKSPQDMVSQMLLSEDEQLDACAKEILSSKIDGSLAAHNWPSFARVYNGSNYAANDYDTNLRTWYAKFAAGALPDIRVRTAQLYLTYLGFHPGVIDGRWGKRTSSAVGQFQLRSGLPSSGNLDDQTMAALTKENS
jgi:hypothetical protein